MIELVEKALAEHNREIAIDRALAEYYCKNKDYEKGLALYKNLEKDDKDIKKYIDYSIEYSAKFFKERKWDKILEIYKDIISYPNVPNSLYKNIGLCLTSIDGHEEALEFLRTYEKLEPQDLQIYPIIGEVLYQRLDKFEEAIPYYEKALELGNESFLVYNTLGHLYSKLYRDSHKEEQLSYFEKAYELEPDNVVIVKNLAYVYGKFDEVEKADKMWQKMLTLNPPYTDLHSYGAYLVKHGRFQEGFKYLRNRFQKEDLPGPAFASILKYKDKMWKIEEPLNNKRVLVHYEQGFGDTIMFIRYVKQLMGMCNSVEVVVQDSLVDLFKDSNIPVPIRTRKEVESTNFDVLIPMMDLPLVCGTTKDTIPCSAGYLNVPDEKVKEYGNKYIKDNKKFKIGFAFEGSEASLETKRDIPLNYFYGLMKFDNIDMYSLQVDDLFGQQDKVPSDCKFKRLGGTFKNWEDTACAIKNMNLIITTDNGIMNLAGALGSKTFGIFNSMSEWRWIDTKGENVKWYNSVKPFACNTTDNWNFAMDNVMNEVRKLV